jgi:hypothetical protein
LLAAIATIIQQLLYAMYLGLVGYSMVQPVGSSLLATVMLQAFLFLLIYWLLYLIQRAVWPKPVRV